MAKEKTDQQLIYNYQNNIDDDSFGILVKRYSKYAKSLAKKYVAINVDSGLSFDDIYAVSLSAVYIAVSNFALVGDNTFYPYWYKIANNEIVRYIQDNSYAYRGKSFKGDVSLDEIKESRLLSDVIGIEDREMEKKRAHDELINVLNNPSNHLTTNEKQIMHLLIEGYTLTEIVVKYKIPSSVVYDRYHRALKKIKKSLNRKS